MSPVSPGWAGLLASSRVGLPLLLAAALLPQALRNWMQSSIWGDELYTILLTGRPLGEMLDIAATDAHPPLYYMLVHAARTAAEALGTEPGIFVVRSVNWAMKAVLVLVAWIGGRRLLGPTGGTAAAWAVGISAAAAYIAREARQYGLGAPLLFACLMLLLLLTRRARTDRGAAAEDAVLWGAYGVSAFLALYTHFLCTVVLFWLGIAWIALAWRSRAGWRSRFVWMGALANGLPALAFTPWLLGLVQQFQYFSFMEFWWSAEASVPNFLRVWIQWYPLSTVGESAPFPTVLLVPGVLSLLVPVGAAIAARKASTNEQPPASPDGALLCAMVSLGVAVANVATLWIVQRLEISITFQGARYTVLTAPFWAFGLASLAVWTWRRRPGRWTHPIVLLLPWLVSSFAGQGYALLEEFDQGFARWQRVHPEHFPEPRTEVFLTPASLLPFYDRILGDYDLAPLSSLLERNGVIADARVYTPSNWRLLDSAGEVALRAALDRPGVARASERTTISERSIYLYQRFEQLNAALVNDATALPAAPPSPANAAAAALPTGQTYGRGWSRFDVLPTGEMTRWPTNERAWIAFDRAVPPGDYTLVVRGVRTPMPQPVVTMEMGLWSRDAAAAVDVPVGAFEIAAPVTVAAETEPPVAFVTHPVWTPEDALFSTQRITFYFVGAWLVPAAD